MYNKYLEELGIPREEYDYTTWGNCKRLRKIKKKTGLDFRECYQFDSTLAYYLYSMLKLYTKYTVTDLEYEKQTFGDFEGTLNDAIKQVCKGLKLYIKYDFLITSMTKKQKKKVAKYLGVSIDDLNYGSMVEVYKKALHLFADIAPCIWD